MESRLRKKTTSHGENDVPRKKIKEEKVFTLGEKVLCYEPDAKLKRVLYDAKIRDVYEINKRGKKCYEYFVHFQGWNTSWDRKVSEDFILKDTPENRHLQRELAEKSQLRLGVYLYRKERKKRKKLNERKLLLCGNSSDETKILQTDSLELEQDYYSSSATESHGDDDRVFLHMGQVLKSHLEYDNKMIRKEKIRAKIPSPLPILTILENFVKSYSIKLITAPQQEQPKPKRQSGILLSRKEQKAKTIDYDGIINNINLCKEVADGLRVYFNFTLKDFLLYAEEKEEIANFLSEENLKNFKYDPGEQLSLNDFFSKQEPAETPTGENSENQTPSLTSEKRVSRLRSHSLKAEEEENLSSMASTSSGDSAMAVAHKKGIFSKSWFPLNAGISPTARKIIEESFEWRMINPQDAEVEPAMIFGIYHLSRLFVKLPEFLSATPMNEEKTSALLKYLDAFVEFLEENPEIYGPQNYVIDNSPESEDIKTEPKEEEE